MIIVKSSFFLVSSWAHSTHQKCLIHYFNKSLLFIITINDTIFIMLRFSSSSSSSIKAKSIATTVRFCSSSTTTPTDTTTTSSSSQSTSSSTSSSPSGNTTTTVNPFEKGMKFTNLAESLWLEQQNPNEKPNMWCSVPTLYRRLVKLYMRKFPDHPDVTVRAWKQTKFEFYHFREAPAEDVPMLVNRGKSIYQAVMGGIIPVVQDPKTKLAYCKYDTDTLMAAGGHVDPISAEEFMRRNKDKLSDEERTLLRDKLKENGRWKGPDEFSDADVPKVKVKRKKKCTDPDEE